MDFDCWIANCSILDNCIIISCSNAYKSIIEANFESTPGLYSIKNDLIKKCEKDGKDYVLGEGSFGVVYKGKLCFKSNSTGPKQEYDIAIKEVKISGDFKETQRIIGEAKIMSMVDHTNVLVLYGICMTADSVQIIMPYRSRGSLWSFLRTERNKINGMLQLDFCRQIASAMDYLNTKDIVHGDLATRNVLISIVSKPNNEDLEAQKYSYQVQVADFGLAKIVNDVVSEEAFSPAFPIKWAAIELVEWELNETYEKKLGSIRFPFQSSPDERLEAHVSPSINEKTDSDGGQKAVGEDLLGSETATLLDNRIQLIIGRNLEVDSAQTKEFVPGQNTLQIKNPPSESDRILSNPSNISIPYAGRKLDSVRKNGSNVNSDNEIDTLSDEGVDEEPDSGVISPSSNDENCEHVQKIDNCSQNRNVEESQKAATFPRNYVSKLKCFDKNAEQQFQNPYI
uniref:Protein kinase domain-containing protein n=1 Tax=Acrobeloides nanus TaxID=290746 RepID=A0A914DDP6_9BILA